MKLIILNGPSGVGKSTIAARLHQDIPSSLLIDIDELRRAIPGYPEKRQETLLLSYEYAADAIEDGLKAGNDVIVDKAISYSDTLDSFIERGKQCGADVYEFLLFADKQTVQKRADERGYRPGGLLTPEKVGELWEKSDVLRTERTNAYVVDTTHLSLEEVFSHIREIVFNENTLSYSRREYKISTYDAGWPQRFNVLAEQLRKIFGDDALEIEHIGSTSVPDMEAKPIIDILVITPTAEKLGAHKKEMEDAGYIFQGQVVANDSVLYREMKNGEILANIHIFLAGHPHVSEMLALRDYLRTHPNDVREYSELKKSLQEKYPTNYTEYRKQKDAYLDGVLKKRVGQLNIDK
jgi:GrpB-like predicted nucleotidyltransferase (UPF0157 family)/predicted kinase